VIDPRVSTYLARLHAESDAATYAAARRQFAGSDAAFAALAQRYSELPPAGRGALLAEHAIVLEEAALSLAIAPAMGEFLYTLSLAKGVRSVLELGSSNGVSTLYFAAALRARGAGKVVATEREPAKCAALRQHVAALGLAEYVDLRQGDVFETVQLLQGPFDLVFIDIWASGYLAIYRAIEPLLAPGSLILADNMLTAPEQVRPFQTYLAQQPHIQSTTLAFESGVEFAVVL